MSGDRLLARIGDVAALLRGVTYEKQASSNKPARGLVPLLRATNINGEIDFGGLVYVPALCVSEFQYLRPGDSVIAASSGSLAVVGKSAPLRTAWNGTFGAFCYALRPHSERIAPFYLSYFLQTSEYRTQVSRLAAGVNINNLKRQHLEDLRIPLRPFPEQHRIVSAIESYFTRLDDAVATLERVQRNLKRYRASVLKAAVEGRLVPTEAELARAEGRSYEPASALLTRILAERRRRWEEAELAKMEAKGKAPKDNKWKAKYVEPVAPDTSELPELPEGWCWASGDQLTEVITKGSSPNWQGFDYCEEGIPFVRSQNIRWGYLNLADLARLPGAFNEKERKSVLHTGDVLLNIVGASIGRSAVATEILSGGNTNQAVAILRPQSGITPSYLCQYLASPSCQALIHATKVDVARANLSLADISRLPIPVPPEFEQSRITAELERNFSIIGEASEVATTNSLRCARLRQSILKWAFEGRLVDQDPTDEPASVLLERIRAERASAALANGARRRKEVRA